MNADDLADEQINDDLKLYGFDPDESWPEYGHGSIVQAYRAGYEAAQIERCGATVHPHHVCDRRAGHHEAHRCDHLGWSIGSIRAALDAKEPPLGPCRPRGESA